MAEAGQGRTGRLADDFFLMVHDDLSGRPRLSDRIFGIGLAGALLSELVVLQAIDVVKGVVRQIADRLPAGDTDAASPLIADVFRDVQAEQSLPVRDWLNYLSQRASDDVARRLEAEGLVYLKPSPFKALGRPGRWLPHDLASAGWPAIDVKLKIYNGRADQHTLMLFGLARATGLKHPSLWEVEDRLQDPAAWEQTLRPLADHHPSLLELLAHTEVVVGSAVTSGRIS
ncbi:MAG: GPP34 family phosphoprotein [Catenulispora sp.]|nr:GPP34 family phosphoprotein [Catenulispora sp.]